MRLTNLLYVPCTMCCLILRSDHREHLVVVDPRAGGTPVGIVTRHDLCERCNAEWQRADATPTATLSRAHASAAEATEGRSSSAELRRARESELGTTRTVGAARC